MFFRCCGFILALCFLSSPVGAVSAFGGTVVFVSDGDTLWVQPQRGGKARKLRIDGIDAPEICQAGGELSRQTLMQWTLHQPVQVSVRAKDKYDRGLAKVFLRGEDVGERMVRAGQAWSYRWQQDAGPYAVQESLARQSRRGLFAAARPERPSHFRKRHGPCHSD
jgi:micrococcal nuclease